MNWRCLYGWLWPVVGLMAIVPSGCARPARETLRVATLNLDHGCGLPGRQARPSRQTIEENLTAIAKVLQRESPDVVALQEADAACDWSGQFDHVAFLADAGGYPHRYLGLHVDLDGRGLSLHYGTALLARRELANPTSHEFHAHPLDSKGYVAAEIEFAGRTVVVVSVHLDSMLPSARREHARELIEQLGKLDTPLIVLGDFNVTWSRANDGLRLIADGLHLRPYQPQARNRDTYPSPDPHWRIDWILISEPLEFRAYQRWPELLSDHLGVTADLVWR
jgi:endonuclease/exonuclease/phosphatase family metal-dependent hydrolase